MGKEKVKLIAPVKLNGKKHAAGSTPEVTSAEALQIAEAGAMEITPSDLAHLRELVAAEAIAEPLSSEQLGSIVDLMQGDGAADLKSKDGKWIAARFAKALGRDVSQDEIDKAAILAAPQE